MFHPKVNYNDLNLISTITLLKEEGKGVTEIAKILGYSKPTIENFVNMLGFPKRPRKYDFDKTVFEKLDTPEKAWLFGWILADGCVCNNRLSIRLKSDDEEVVVKFRDVLKSNTPLHRTKNSVGIAIFSEKLANDLKSLGCQSKKSLTMEFPKNIPEHLYRHFLRGYFEGDGCISYNKRRNSLKINFKGTKEFLEGVKNRWCTGNLYHASNSIENVYNYDISSYTWVVSMLNMFYYNVPDHMVLNRKFNKAKQLYNKKQESRKNFYNKCVELMF